MTQSSLAPALLLAMPQLLDANFRRAVVLLVHHDANGTFGLVVNRGADITARDLCSTLEVQWQGEQDQLVGWGGPVQPDTGWVLFGDEPAANDEATEVSEGIHFAGSLDTLRSIAEMPPVRLKLLLGYAGWGPGQLEQELAQGAWLLTPPSPELVFEVADGDLWERALRDLGVDPATLISTPGIH